MITTYFVPESLDHDSGPGHPESPERIKSVNRLFETLEKEGLIQSNHPSPAKDLSLFRMAHDPQYIDFLERPQAALPLMLDADTRFSRGSLDALRGLSGAITLISQHLETSIKTPKPVFLLARPPGHHAKKAGAMGFCLVNSIATQALFMKGTHPNLRIAIYDFDVHHGNGTEEILGGIPGVLFVSTHQHPYYPGTGSGKDNRIGNRGEGILDIPLPAGTTDEDYQRVFEELILPRIVSFAPDILLVSAGFDGHRDDPLGGFLLTEKTYHLLGRELKEVFPQIFIVSILEGGYNLKALTESVRSYMEGLSR